jgi:hypothetical protein
LSPQSAKIIDVDESASGARVAGESSCADRITLRDGEQHLAFATAVASER